MNQGILTQLPQPPAMPYGLLGRPTPVPMPAVDYALDVDAADYIRRVEAADGQALELPIKLAVDAFVRGCKADGIWGSIKASCIMAGARTLSGALIPLVGTAPTSLNFVAADYNRKTGLVGDGSTKRLVANRAANADPQNNRHIALYIGATSAKTAFSNLICDSTNGSDVVTQLGITPGATTITARASNTSGDTLLLYAGVGYYGLSRSASATYQARGNSATQTVVRDSQAPLSNSYGIFMRSSNADVAPTQFYDGRLSFYSIGEALDLALLDARVTQLMNSLAVVL